TVREKLMILDYLENNNNKLLQVALYVEKLHSGKQAKYSDLEDKLFNWINETRASGNPVTCYLINKKAIDLSQHERKTTIAQHLAPDLIDKQNSFLSYMLYRRIQHDYPLKYICNMDETLLWFDLLNNNTIDIKGKKSISIRTTGYKRSSFTVILTYIADGTKLLAVCIFKLKNVPRENFPHDIYIRANENIFHAHLMDSVKNQLVEKNTNLVVIPSSCTSKLQPLDVVINKSFKSKISSAIHTFTPKGCIRKPSYSTVATWCCGISTQTEDSEDYMLFNYDNLLEQDEVNNNLGDSEYGDSEHSDSEYSDHYIEDNKYRNEWNIASEN
ncbi:3343_t:CDS:2, partial [Scutellospora calospora]